MDSASDAAARSPATRSARSRHRRPRNRDAVRQAVGRLATGAHDLRIDPKSWTVEHMDPTVGYRPHGVGIENARYLWEADTNMGAFFKRHMVTGEIVDSIQSPGYGPIPRTSRLGFAFVARHQDSDSNLCTIVSRSRHPENAR
jgi:hypothetical protein